MRTQTFVLTPVPNGRTPDGRLKLSVHLSIRLASDVAEEQILRPFPDIVQWGTTGGRLRFAVDFGVGAPQEVEPENGPDALLWPAVFKSTCPVKPFTFTGFEGRKVRSFPAANVKKYLQGLYSSFGLSNPLGFPTSDALLAGNAMGTFASTGPDDVVHTRLVQKVEQLIAPTKVIPPSKYALSAVGTDLTQVEILHRPRPKGRPKPAPELPDLDFHQGVAALAAHPGLLRRLGLVFDLLVPIPAGYANALWVSVAPVWGSGDLAFPMPPFTGPAPANRSASVSPRVFIVPSTFKAAGRATNALVVGGRLNLADERYAVSDLDLDGAALKILGTASSVKRAAASDLSSPSSPKTHPLPALRSEGLVLLHSGKAASVQAAMGRQRGFHTKIQTGDQLFLDAEDLVRGYRIDIWDDTDKRWSPLGMRSVTYRPLGRPAFTVDDEGAVSLAVTSDGEGGPVPDVFVPEVVAKWSGWSVVAPRLGQHLKKDDLGLTTSDSTANATEIKVGIETSVPRPAANLPGLPRLRFGRAYRIRARAADLAGHGESFSNIASDTRAASALSLYSRYEPVPPPVVLQHEDSTPGSGVLRMVIRSDVDTFPGDVTIRHLVTPNAGQLMVEQCGALDDGRSPAELYDMLRFRDGQLLDNPDANDCHPDPTSPQNAAGAQELVYPGSFVTIPYLPDPLSRGVVLYGLPFGTTTVANQKIPGGNARMEWKRTRGFETVLANRIRLSELRGTTAYAHTVTAIGPNGEQELHVLLPKATVVRTSLRSFLGTTGLGPTSDVDRMGIWQWLLQGAPTSGMTSGQISDLKKKVAAGLHWMITPAVEIELVHAVRRPLLPPAWQVASAQRVNANGDAVTGNFAGITGTRQPGETAARLVADIRISGRSTGRVNVIAEWSESVDPVDEPTHRQQAFRARPCHFDVDHLDKEKFPVATDAGAPVPVAFNAVGRQTGTHELPDTRHRMITYSLEAVSPFVEEFTEQATVSFPARRFVTLADTALVPGHASITDGGGATYSEGRDFVLNIPSPGCLQLTDDADVPVDQPVTVRFVRGPVSRFSTETAPLNEAKSTTLNILATARPKAPDLQYVLPAYQWSPWKASLSQDQKVRTGNLLRVWLGRPWFSSGDGEELAVVCPTGTLQPDAMDPLHSHVSLIGMDPVWGDSRWTATDNLGNAINAPGIPTRKILTPANFPLAKRPIASGLRVPELGDKDLAAAVHTVDFDEERKLWFCDIAIDPVDTAAEPYTPFVQLALARFQASSVVRPSDGVDLRLSPIVLAELAQLAPNRTVTIVKANGRFQSIKITGTSYRATPATINRAGNGDYVGSLPGPSLMVCQAQVPGPGMDPARFPDTAWINEGAPQVMKGSVTTAGAATWTLVPTLPATRPVRLVFTEYEDYELGAPVRPGDPAVRGRVAFTASYRLG